MLLNEISNDKLNHNILPIKITMIDIILRSVLNKNTLFSFDKSKVTKVLDLVVNVN